MILTQIYSAHFRQLDFFPVWSSSDAYGLGTPVLLYYNKLFFFVSGGLDLLLGGAIKPTMIVSTAFFMAVGAYGMRIALSTITRRRLLLLVGPLAFIFTNYAFSDWLVRGDFAEFSAMMLVPWLLWWCLDLINVRRASFAIIPIFTLLVLAHLAIALVSMITICVAILTFAVVAGPGELKRNAKRLLISAIGSGLLLTPLLVASLLFDRLYDPTSKITQSGYLASNNIFYSRSGYFVNTAKRFFPGNGGISYQIDFAIWIPIALGLLLLFGAKAALRRRVRIGESFRVPAMIFLLVSLGAYILLQFPVSRPLYEHIKVLEDVQFPWRMLALIDSLGIVVVIAGFEAAYRKIDRRIMGVVAILWLTSFVALSPVFSTYPSFMAPSVLAAPAHLRYGQYPEMIGVIGEYLPQVAKESSLGTLERDELLFKSDSEAQAVSVSHHKVQALSAAKCAVTEPPDTAFEALHVTMTITCDRATAVALPISKNAFTSIAVRNAKNRFAPVAMIRVINDPRIVIWVPSSKSQHLSINLPTLWRVLF